MTTAIAPRPVAMSMGSLADPKELGNILAASGYFDDAREAAKAVVKVLAGAELGFGPIASMTGVYIVKGRVTLSANLMAAQVKRWKPRYDYRVRDLTNDQAVIAFFEDGEEVGTSEFTMADAQKAKLADGDNWTKYPRNMLFARAMSNGAKFYCPEVFGGSPVYTPDELGADIDPETGEILEASIVPAESPRPERPAPPSDRKPAPATTGGTEAAGQRKDVAPSPDTSTPAASSVPVDDPDRPVTPEEVKALRDLLERHGAPEPFWRMALMGYGVSELEALTAGQAREVMDKANARFGS